MERLFYIFDWKVSDMKIVSIRLSSITLENFKNVEYGFVSFKNGAPFSSNVCGIYGQNGSGKTSLVDAVEILKVIMCGDSLSEKYVDYIMVDKEYAQLAFTFDITVASGVFSVEYKTKIGRGSKLVNGNNEKSQKEIVPNIYDEVLSYSFESSEKKIKKNILINTETEKNNIFIPSTKYKAYFGNDNVIKSKLMLFRELVRYNSGSFVFSSVLLSQIRVVEVENKEEDFIRFKEILETLIIYANTNLFVINTANTGFITLNSLPLSISFNEKNHKLGGMVMLNLDKPTNIPDYQFTLISKAFDNMNIVLDQIVPGLKMGINDLGPTTLENGDRGRIISIDSYKNKRPIPLVYESEGIKKIISILHLLIAVFNQKSITVVIDELDSGIFEYLLGEIMKIISEKGEGQLIFTSHNLRPLETLDKHCVAFSTTNPKNRYIRFTNVKSNNNLRSFYYRDIILGEQSEEVYASTNNAEIAMAFREAGEVHGS